MTSSQEITNQQLFNLLPTSLQKSDEIKEEIRSIKADFKKQLDVLKKENQNLQEENNRLKNRVINAERKLKKYNLIFYGIPEQEQKLDDVTSVLDLLTSKLGFESDYSDIRDWYRLGQKREGNSRPLLIECINNHLKIHILQNSRKLKGTGIYISEDYTPEGNERRRFLVENLKVARQNGSEAYIRNNKLIVNNQTYTYEDLKTRPVNLANVVQRGNTKDTQQNKTEQSVNKNSQEKKIQTTFEKILETRGNKRKAQRTVLSPTASKKLSLS